jgi:hypothetical protein
MTVRTHELKSWSRFFHPIRTGQRTHELRRNDRDFRIGDRLLLREFDPEGESYTGSVCEVVITSITSREAPCAVSDEGLHPDFCILSIRVLSVSPHDA